MHPLSLSIFYPYCNLLLFPFSPLAAYCLIPSLTLSLSIFYICTSSSVSFHLLLSLPISYIYTLHLLLELYILCLSISYTHYIFHLFPSSTLSLSASCTQFTSSTRSTTLLTLHIPISLFCTVPSIFPLSPLRPISDRPRQ